jgi:hypothetical protein
MKLPRRKFLHLATGAAALSAMPRIARAQTYPSRIVMPVFSLMVSNALTLALVQFDTFRSGLFFGLGGLNGRYRTSARRVAAAAMRWTS